MGAVTHYRDTEAGTFHVFTHGVWAANALYRDDVDRITFVRELARATGRIEWKCHAFCVMKTHYHLLLTVEAGVLARGMHAINFRYAMHFNRRHGMKGHVMAARYDSRRINDERDLLTVFRYIARNPVDAGFCSAPPDWQWSSYAGSVGAAEPASFVDASLIVACFGEPREVAIQRLRTFVEES